MNARSIIRLAQGLGVQILCYAGIFLSLTIAARALDPTDFGIYASSVAVASFAGSVLTAGLDRILLRVLLHDNATGEPGRVRLSLLIPAILLNAFLLVVAGVLALTGLAAPTLAFVAMLGALVAVRLTLGGFFKFTRQNYSNVVATFGLQPLVVGLMFGGFLLFAPNDNFVTNLRGWIAVTLLVEAVQAALLVQHARRGGLVVAGDEGRSVLLRESIAHAKAGTWISLLVLLAQTGLFGLSLGTLLLSPADMGIYTIALRVSQLIQFPYIGATQLLVPISSRSYDDADLPVARDEARNIIRVALACLVLAILGFAILGLPMLRLVMTVDDPRAYYCTLILSIGNLGMALFGIGDQIMIAIGRHRQAFWISFWCGGVLFLSLGTAALLASTGLIGLACASSTAIAARAFFGYLAARRLVRMPVAAFDR